MKASTAAGPSPKRTRPPVALSRAAVHTLQISGTLPFVMQRRWGRPAALGALAALAVASSACGGSTNDAVGGASGSGAEDAGLGGTWATGGHGGSSANAGAGGSGSGSAGIGGSAAGGTGGAPGDGGAGGSAGAGASGGASSWTCSGTCTGLCANVVAAACTVNPAEASQAACEAACQAEGAKTPKECDCAWQNYLECGALGTVQCSKQICNGGACVDVPGKIIGCESELSLLNDCAKPCVQEGAHVGGGLGGTGGLPSSFEQAGSQCACPNPLKPGAAPGAACQFFSDCAEHCCDCPKDKGKYRTRLCLNGKCAGVAQACATPEPGICYVDP